jgi:hypothetical protein
MNRRQIRAALIAGTATALIVAGIGIANQAQAAGEPTGRCWVSPDQYARLSVTKYASGSGYQYHMDLNSSTPVLGTKYYQQNIFFDGVRQSGTDDIYKNVSGGSHTVKGTWTMSNGSTATCQVTL